MSDEDALLAAVLADPDDDTPRLVYADWLDEHDRPERAEFIRLQCRLAGEAVTDPADEERADELEVEHRHRWLADLPQRPGVAWAFRRGFPETLAVSAKVFLERYDRFAAVPWVRELCLDDVDRYAARDFVSRAWNPRWLELELIAADVNLPGRAAVVVANSPRVCQLRRLWLTAFDFSGAEVEELAASPHLDALRLLGISGDRDRPLFAPLRERFGGRFVGEGE